MGFLLDLNLNHKLVSFFCFQINGMQETFKKKEVLYPRVPCNTLS